MLLDKVIAGALVLLSAYMMSHAILLPIGWNGETGGPGGGAFPFWCSLIILICAVFVIFRPARSYEADQFSFDREMMGPLIQVIVAIAVTISLIPTAGAYVAMPLFLFWYLKIYGKHSWTLALSITMLTPIVVFFFFEATLKILLPKGITEPFFFPLYAMFF